MTLTALALLAGCGSETDPAADPGADPSPTAASAAPRELVTTVPADFPLDAGPDSGGTEWSPMDGEPLPIYVCGPDRSTAGTDRRGITVFGGETNEQRELTLYADDATATAALDAVSEAIDACPEQDRGEGEFVAPRLLTSDLGEGSVAWLDQYGDGNGPNGDGTAWVLTRVGNALLLGSSFLYGGAKDLDEGQRTVNRIGDESAQVVDAMCVFSAAGCADDIPDGFDLGVGLVSGGDGAVVGPARSVDGVDLAALCAVPGWPGDDATDRMAARATGPEYEEVRELVTFSDADAAIAAMGVVQQGFSACRPESGTGVAPMAADTGYESSLTYTLTYDVGLGGTIVQLVRVGRAVLVVSSTGELLRETAQESTDAFTEGNRKVTDLLCEWTEAGC